MHWSDHRGRIPCHIWDTLGIGKVTSVTQSNHSLFLRDQTTFWRISFAKHNLQLISLLIINRNPLKKVKKTSKPWVVTLCYAVPNTDIKGIYLKIMHLLFICRLFWSATWTTLLSSSLKSTTWFWYRCAHTTLLERERWCALQQNLVRDYRVSHEICRYTYKYKFNL